MRPFDAILHTPETEIVRPLIAAATLDNKQVLRATALAQKWTEHLRTTSPPAIEGLLQDIGLASPAGLALMGLAEALLRTPDDATINELIDDKLGDSLTESDLVARRMVSRLAEFGLGISNMILESDEGLRGKIKSASLPFMRMALRRVVRRMGNNFIIGEDVKQAFENAAGWAARGHLMHYDMLGEGARTMQDADRYFSHYQQLINAMKGQSGRAMADNAGVSIKLSALHPRFEELQKDRVMSELYPRVLDLCERAAGANIVLCIDAEEADRFEITLDVIEKLALEPQLKHWTGLGFAVQAYQTRARAAVDWFVNLAERRGSKLTLRLLKVAYFVKDMIGL
jgi:RHH-type proline utilization regulon transcriptional repressor/proline dehydrogenase/delta 1-pyrroline-5-carboxylate dehydrogenase